MPRTVSLIGESQIRQILAQLRQHALSGFPNPDRRGCPDRATLRSMALRVKSVQPTNDWVSHVASCSPCFREYTQMRKSSRQQRIAMIVAGVAASILLAVGLFSFWPKSRIPAPPAIVQRSTPPTPIATVMVNLASLTQTRGETSVAKRVTLPASRLRARFLMPIGSEPGTYEIRISRPNGDDLINTTVAARIDDGVTSFEVELPLETFGGVQLTLMVRPPGLNWQRFPLYVE